MCNRNGVEGDHLIRLVYQLIILQLCLAYSGGTIRCTDSRDLSSQLSWGEPPQFTPCPVNNQTAQFYNDISNDCSYYSNLALVACASAADAAACWRTSSTGNTTELRFPLLPNHCDFTAYQVSLLVSEAEDCMSISPEDYKLHSTMLVNIRPCDQPYCSDQCHKWGTVKFRHVFSGCYKLLVSPCKNMQKKDDMMSAAAFLDTGRSRSFIMEPLMENSTAQSARLSMKATMASIPTQATITLMRCGNTSEPCFINGIRLLTYETNWESPDIKIKDKLDMCEKLSVKCYYQDTSRKTVTCDFSNLDPGNYIVRIQYFDDRCSLDYETFWGYYNPTDCIWELPYEVLPKPDKRDDSGSSFLKHPYLVVSILLLAIVAGILTVYLVYHKIQPKNGRQPLLPNPINFLQPAVTKDRPVVLLLYARDCQDFMAAVAQLRNIICNICNCQVVDVWDEDQCRVWEALGAARWVQSQLMNTTVHVVYVTSPLSCVVEVAQLQPGGADWGLVYKERCQLLSHALVCIRENTNFQADNRLFVVRLDTYEEDEVPQVKTYLYPQRSYFLPVHLNALLSSLQNLNPVECRVIEEYEPLTAAIEQYQRYLKDNPCYLESLLDCRLNSNRVSVYEMLRPNSPPQTN